MCGRYTIAKTISKGNKMKHLIVVALVLSCIACTTTQSIPQPIVVDVPYPMIPKPPAINIAKEGGLHTIQDTTSDGDVVKAYIYEVEYWKGLASIQQLILDNYTAQSVDLKQIETKIRDAVNKLNEKLQGTK